MTTITALRVESLYEALGTAIVAQAAEDYKRCRFVIDTINLRKYKNDESKYNCLDRAKREVKSVERFFKTEWFYALSGLNGERAMKALKETYINEYYPVRMEELLDVKKNARFRHEE